MQPSTEKEGKAPDHPAAKNIAGVVHGPDGAAVADADVYLEVRRLLQPNKLLFPALPVAEEAKWQLEPKPEYLILSHARTDATGRFTLQAEPIPPGDETARIVTAAKHLGLSMQFWDGKAGELEIRLPPMVLIDGRLLTPDRTGAADVVVKAIFLSRDKDYFPAVDQFLPEKDYPPYWPKPVRTDSGGGFILEGIPAGYHLGLELSHPSFAKAVVRVDTGQGSTEMSLAFEVPLLPPMFSYALEPARPVEGLVTASDTGKPLADVLVCVTSMDRHGGMGIYTHTDAAGHFCVNDKAGETYFITVYPPPELGYMAESVCGEKWPKGAKSFVQDFKLARGVVISGRVLDDSDGKPIAGASVEYHPSQKNPNRKTAIRDRSYEYRSPVFTNSDGRFALTGLAGTAI